MDLDDERARLAAETATAARSLSRLANLAAVLQRPSAEVDIDQLNDMAGRMHRWSLEVARDLDRPLLAEELEQRHRAFLDWQDVRQRVRGRSPLGNS